ncbi:DUF3798 domain-containing protein [Clostridium culturomicium]|uniref:DUF3798 domain-containing protein n=1 Tax=Clostridium culturomicium TaxID=1499683 RepID=UPI003857B0A4
MKKKLLAICLSAAMIVGIAGCAPKAPTSEEDSKGKDYKIGIITGTVSQGEEEYRAAENMKKQYGDMIVLQTYPDSFMKEQETTIANTLALAADPDVKAIIFVQAVPGASAAIDKVRETNPDMLFIAGVPGEDPAMIGGKADVILQADELGMGVSVIEQAKKQGAKTFVHYTFPRHMSYEMLAKRRDLFKETCEKEGIKFVDATAPDPTGDAGVPGAQQFILEDVPRKVAEYGKDTAFFSTNCSMQEPLIKMVLKEGAIFPQQCCPSPYHAYPGALGIEIPDDKKGDVAYIVDQIGEKIKAGGGEGRFSTWPVPINMMFVEGGVKYAMAFLDGETDGKNDKAKLTEILNSLLDDAEIKITPYIDAGSGKTYDNYYLILSDYINF